mgnify:FL=1
MISLFISGHWGNLWDVVEGHHIGPEELHLHEGSTNESWSWVGLQGVSKLDDVSLLEPVLRVEVLLGEAWGLCSLKTLKGCVHCHEGVQLIDTDSMEVTGIAPTPEPSKDPVKETVQLCTSKLCSEDVSELKHTG